MEMALVLPICIALVMNFIAIMLVVQVKAEVTAATSLAAQSAVSAPVDSVNSCNYASDSFFSTLFNTNAGAGGCPASTSPGIAVTRTPTAQDQARGFANAAVTLTCVDAGPGNYFTGVGYPPPAATTGGTGPPITCTSVVSMDFANTPLGFAVPWKPTITVTALVFPSAVRQSCPTAAC